MSKRLWSILLVLCMMLSLVPVGASAAKVVDSGTCGENLSWTLTDSGMLTISGTGDMMDYDAGTTPWFRQRESVKRVKIDNGVKCIGNWAFSDCERLVSASIPSSVMSIKEYAFAGCVSLTSVEIPNGMLSIGGQAFQGCICLASITIPDSVMIIGDAAFANCSKLASVTIPDTVTSIGDSLFADCSSLTSVIIPDSVTSVGDYAFAWCSNLMSITIPNSVTRIGVCAFYCCKSLKTIAIPLGITRIEAWTFRDCSELSSVTIPDGVLSIGNYAFYDCSVLKSIRIPDGVTSIEKNAFEYCTSLKMVTIPASMTTIQDYAFKECYSLADAYYAGSKLSWDNITIGKNNDSLTEQATIHYNSNGPNSTDTPTPTLNPTPAPTTKPTFIAANKEVHLTEKQDVVMVKATLPYADAAYLKSCLENLSITTTDLAMKTAEKIVVAKDGKSAELIYTLDPYASKEAHYNFWWDTGAGASVIVYGIEPNETPWSENDQWTFTNTLGRATDFDKTTHGYFITTIDYNRLLSNLSPYDASIIDYKTADPSDNTPAMLRYNVDGKRTNHVKWGGSCLGMSITSALIYGGVLDTAKDFGQGKAIPTYQIKISDAIRSDVNYYHHQWKLTAWQNANRDFMNLSVGEQLRTIEKLVQTGMPVVIAYEWIDYKKGSDISSHAVVAYGVENGSFPVESDGQELTYTKKLLIYDCADPNNDKCNIYYSVRDGDSGIWCLPAHNIISTQSVEKDEIEKAEDNGSATNVLPRYNNGAFQIATNDVNLLNAVSLRDGSVSAAVVNAKLNSARLYALSDDAYTIKTKNGTVAMDGIRYKKTGMSGDKVTVSMAPNYLAGGTTEPSEVTVFLPEKDSYTVSSDNLLSYGFADNNKAAFVNAGASGDIVFKPTCETSVSADKKTEISVTAFNNESKASWDSITVTAENADDLTIVPNDIVVTVSGDLEKAEIEITKDGKTTKEKLDTKDESISFTVLDGRVIPVDPGPTNTPAPSAQPTTAPTVEPSQEPYIPADDFGFADVADDAYYYDAVLWALGHNPQITTGVDSTHFAPNKDCTRAQMVTFLWRAAGEPKPESTRNPFTDVKKGAYYYDAVLWAVEQGITTGTSKTTFSPNATVTRAQTVTFLWRMEGEPAVKTKNPFTDVKSGQYYTNAVLWAVKKNITNGLTATTFGPANPCTRAQIVTFLWRAMA